MASRAYQRKKFGYKIQAKKEMIAIVVLDNGGHKQFLRYHTQDILHILNAFELFVRKELPEALYINYYSKGVYLRRSYVNRPFIANSLNCPRAIEKRPTLPYPDRHADVMRIVQFYSLH